MDNKEINNQINKNDLLQWINNQTVEETEYYNKCESEIEKIRSEAKIDLLFWIYKKIENYKTKL